MNAFRGNRPVLLTILSMLVIAFGACVTERNGSSTTVPIDTPVTPTASLERIVFATGETIPLCLPPNLEIIQPTVGFESENGSIVGDGVHLSVAKGSFVVSDLHVIVGIPPVSQNLELRNEHIVETFLKGNQTVTLVRPVAPTKGSTGAFVPSAFGGISISGTNLPASSESVVLEMLKSMFDNEC